MFLLLNCKEISRGQGGREKRRERVVDREEWFVINLKCFRVLVPPREGPPHNTPHRHSLPLITDGISILTLYQLCCKKYYSTSRCGNFISLTNQIISLPYITRLKTNPNDLNNVIVKTIVFSKVAQSISEYL